MARVSSTRPDDLVVGQVEVQRPKGDLVAHGGVEELGVGALEHHADTPPKALGHDGFVEQGAATDALAEGLDLALRGLDEPGQDLEQGRLARAVGARGWRGARRGRSPDRPRRAPRSRGRTRSRRRSAERRGDGRHRGARRQGEPDQRGEAGRHARRPDDVERSADARCAACAPRPCSRARSSPGRPARSSPATCRRRSPPPPRGNGGPHRAATAAHQAALAGERHVLHQSAPA